MRSSPSAAAPFPSCDPYAGVATLAFIGVNRLGSPAPKSFTAPLTDSCVTYRTFLPAMNIRTDSETPSATADRMSSARSSSPPKSPV